MFDIYNACQLGDGLDEVDARLLVVLEDLQHRPHGCGSAMAQKYNSFAWAKASAKRWPAQT